MRENFGPGESGIRYGSAAAEFRPREKLAESGPSTLSDTELLAALLGHGVRGKGVKALADEILSIIDMRGNHVDFESLSAVVGVGKAKAAALAAALEFCRRLYVPADRKILMPRDILQIVAHYADRQQEKFLCVSLNGAHEVIAVRIVSVGLVNRAIVHPREVFADPITDRASAVIVAHNHPSGNLEPSEEDAEITRRLREAGKTLGIELLDHIVFCARGYYSFLEHGRL
jgi:DNA repair protein RadC